MRIRSFILLIICSFTFYTKAQFKLDYDHDSKWYWGVNFGGTWHTSDIRTKVDNGWGFTVGRSFNYNYGKKVSFDIRGRFLAGDWTGLNKSVTYLDSTYDNSIYASIYHDYQQQYGYVVENFQTRINRLSLELVIHVNALRESTGIDPYIFGGIGYTWTKTRGSLLDTLGQMYAYDDTKDYSAIGISNLVNGKYDTELDYGDPDFKAHLMPSIGIGLGYQVAPRFSIGVEHKTTFTQWDEFDAKVLDSKYPQDIYHYTSCYFRFQIRSKRYDDDEPTHSTTDKPVYMETVRNQPPFVDITNPGQYRTVVKKPQFPLKALVKDVRSNQNVVLKHNGIALTDFAFGNQFVTRNMNLVEGENKIYIQGLNEFGKAQDSVIIIYEKPEALPPVVKITAPVRNPMSTTASAYVIQARVENVESKNQIIFNLNGQSLTKFSYNMNTKMLKATINLSNGNNVVTITATNKVGVDSKNTTIIHRKPNQPANPRTPTFPPRTPNPTNPRTPR